MALGEGCSVTQAVMAHRRGPCGPKWRMALPLKVGSFNSQERAPAPALHSGSCSTLHGAAG